MRVLSTRRISRASVLLSSIQKQDIEVRTLMSAFALSADVCSSALAKGWLTTTATPLWSEDPASKAKGIKVGPPLTAQWNQAIRLTDTFCGEYVPGHSLQSPKSFVSSSSIEATNVFVPSIILNCSLTRDLINFSTAHPSAQGTDRRVRFNLHCHQIIYL